MAPFVRSAIILKVVVQGRVIRTTDEHPFWVDGKGWTPARELKAGDQLLTVNKSKLAVENVFETGDTETVYNFRVADWHTYFVGSQDWDFEVWVHNACGPGGANGPPPRTGAKRGPKTDPNAPHNAKIRSEAENLLAEGNEILSGGGGKERLIPTPGGNKSGRRPDIEYRTPGGKIKGMNIGKIKANGTPILRELEALDDLNGPGGLPTVFVPYSR